MSKAYSDRNMARTLMKMVLEQDYHDMPDGWEARNEILIASFRPRQRLSSSGQTDGPVYIPYDQILDKLESHVDMSYFVLPNLRCDRSHAKAAVVRSKRMRKRV